MMMIIILRIIMREMQSQQVKFSQMAAASTGSDYTSLLCPTADIVVIKQVFSVVLSGLSG